MTCKSMTVYNNTVLGDGAVNDALVLEYSAPLLPDSIYPGAYEVFGRQILRAYVSERPEPGAPGRGPYVVLELDPVDILERIRGRDEHICIHEQSLAVRQREAVQAENGERLTAMKTFQIAVKNRTPQLEGFQQFQKDGIRYNLFAPAPLEKGRQYPMVLFIHDAGSNGSDPRLTLLQGLGATAFASPETQAESPCFVLAPEVPAG